jgi:hypothetical protein
MSWWAESLPGNGHHYKSVSGYESDKSLETGHAASEAFQNISIARIGYGVNW